MSTTVRGTQEWTPGEGLRLNSELSWRRTDLGLKAVRENLLEDHGLQWRSPVRLGRGALGWARQLEVVANVFLNSGADRPQVGREM